MGGVHGDPEATAATGHDPALAGIYGVRPRRRPMRIRLEKRQELSRPMLWLTPALAVALTMLTGAIIFTLHRL